MNKNDPFELFRSASSKKFLKDIKKTVNEKPSSPIPSNSEVNQMFEKIYEMRSEILAKLDLFCEKTGISKEEIQNFFDNPDNFSPQKWEQVQVKRQSLEQQIISIFGQGAAPQKSNQKLKKISKERKGKTLGARQRWIPL